MLPIVNIALIAHDNKKQELILFVQENRAYFDKMINIYATGTTGSLIVAATNLDINILKSGPIGGDQQIGALIASNEVDALIFFRDPLTAQPHEPDILALLRLCDVYNKPLATNKASALLLINNS
ncbi:MAG: methylglyoxal synthase [Bacilli bacterium]